MSIVSCWSEIWIQVCLIPAAKVLTSVVDGIYLLKISAALLTGPLAMEDYTFPLHWLQGWSCDQLWQLEDENCNLPFPSRSSINHHMILHLHVFPILSSLAVSPVGLFLRSKPQMMVTPSSAPNSDGHDTKHSLLWANETYRSFSVIAQLSLALLIPILFCLYLYLLIPPSM